MRRGPKNRRIAVIIAIVVALLALAVGEVATGVPLFIIVTMYLLVLLPILVSGFRSGVDGRTYLLGFGMAAVWLGLDLLLLLLSKNHPVLHTILLWPAK